jgi:hypothetical protein
VTTIAFDTLKFARALQAKAKLSAQRAEGFAEALAEALHEDLATKADFWETELRLEARIEASKSEIVKWLFGTIGFQTLIIFGAVVALARATQP